ncbi:MAG: hypothetical protein ACRENX_07920 [Candidatus Dormibacteria bacterium]
MSAASVVAVPVSGASSGPIAILPGILLVLAGMLLATSGFAISRRPAGRLLRS